MARNKITIKKFNQLIKPTGCYVKYFHSHDKNLPGGNEFGWYLMKKGVRVCFLGKHWSEIPSKITIYVGTYNQ